MREELREAAGLFLGIIAVILGAGVGFALLALIFGLLGVIP
jgi:hypothetical protein